MRVTIIVIMVVSAAAGRDINGGCSDNEGKGDSNSDSNVNGGDGSGDKQW